MQKGSHRNIRFFTIAVSDTVGSVRLHGELPSCDAGFLPAGYYRHLETVLRRRCEALPEPGELFLKTVIFAPDAALCSVHVEARLSSGGRTLPFFTDGCVWTVPGGQPVRFRALTGSRFSLRKLMPLQKPRREPDWLLRTCPDWEKRMRRALSRSRFYLEADSIVLYLPPMTLDVPLENLCRLPYPLKS